MRRKLALLFLLPILFPLAARADEGMWLVQAISAALQQRMVEEGLELDPKCIYDADVSEGTLCGAVVSMDFIGTGSVISPEGLLITNHHVAYSDLAALNLLETGFWARSRDEELPIPGKKVQILRKVFDVTEQTRAVSDSLEALGQRAGMRKLSYLLERRYAQPGCEASLQQMWAGEKYYMAVYEVYDDVRLVAAPPVSVAAFGGDEDNWEWPQHKGDFTLYRIYRDGRPLESPWHLKVAAEGLSEGDFAMVLGYPGRTRRYSSSFEMRHHMEVEWPVTTVLRGRQMEILRRWMDADPIVRQKYADRFFSLSNVQEMQEGEAACCRRFGVVAAKEAEERELAAWIASDPSRQAEWGDVLDALQAGYSAAAAGEGQKVVFRETLIRGTMFAPTILRMHNDRSGRKDEIYEKGLAGVDSRVEQELLAHSLRAYFGRMEKAGPGQQALYERCSCDPDSLSRYLWAHTDSYGDFLTEVKMDQFPGPSVSGNEMSALRQRYTRALYAMRADRGADQYPDANSSLRLTFGRVCSLRPRDGVSCSWKTTSRGLLEKNDPARHDFALPAAFLDVLPEYGGPVNFITDCDITGGNSGSPVLSGRGELVGLAFDGNKESLSSDFYFVEETTRCVCVDIRYILFILDRYAGLSDLVAEIK